MCILNLVNIGNESILIFLTFKKLVTVFISNIIPNNLLHTNINTLGTFFF